MFVRDKGKGPRFCCRVSRLYLLERIEKSIEDLEQIKYILYGEQREGFTWLDNGFNLNAGEDETGAIIRDLYQLRKLLKYDDVSKELSKDNE